MRSWALFGTTPGKWVAGLRVRTLRNEKPPLGDLLARNLRMYFSGLALGFPLVSLFTIVRSFHVLKANELVSWDTVSNTRVYDVGSSLARTWLAAVLVFVVYFVMTALGIE